MARSTVQWTTYQLVKMKDQINFDLPFQRRYVRRKDRSWQSLLMHTVLTDGYIPNLLVWKNGDSLESNSRSKTKNIYYAVDCLQRLNTLFLFIDDGFALTDDIPLVGEQSVSGLKFSGLPEDLQQAVMGYSFAVTIFDESYSLEDVEEIFYRVNQTKPLSDIEQSQVLLGEDNRSVLKHITDSELFRNVNFTKADIEGYVDRKTAVQVVALLSGRDMSFSGKDMKLYMREIGKTPIDTKIVAEIEKLSEYMMEGFQDWTSKMFKSLKKSVVPSLFIAARKAQVLNLSATDFGLWAQKFLIDEYDKDSEFGETLSRKTANKEVIQRRTDLMVQSMESFANAVAQSN
ncbi:DUF262 domain-containing protein [Cohnella massiliensis]|uniref:DUF262 domain-containing protein n=1 Tax=Cohnella massiliensis TaxID=1816691 RepID=UPI0009BB3858|nr:DUF262 domain-containing protein [Cohnella massiliensis]